MAGTRKSARMLEKRRQEEENEERKREDDRKRQRTLFQRKDNVIWKNDLVVNTNTGKVVLVPEEVPEDVKVKVEANDAEEEMEQLDHRQETDDNHGPPINQFEAQLASLKLEIEEMKQLVQAQDQKIVQLTTELESEKQKTGKRFEEHENMTKAELEVFKAENRKLEAIVNQLTSKQGSIEVIEGERNSSRKETFQLAALNPVIAKSDSEPFRKGNPAQGHSKDVAVSPSVTNENNVANATKTPMIEDPDMEAVLSRILKYVEKDFQSLKTFRLVSRAWNRVSLSTWRNTAVITLCRGIEVSKFLMEYENDRSPYKLADKPYSRYKLKNVFIHKSDVWYLFWELIGPLMEYVHFQDCVIANSTSDAFSKLLIDKMPNLKELTLTSVKYNSYNESDTKMPLLQKIHLQLQSLVVSGRNDIHLERLLVCLPSLRSISVVNEGDKVIYDSTLDKICNAKILNPACLPELKQLDFLNTYTHLKACPNRSYFPRKLERLVRANLQLESLAISLIPVCNWGEANIDAFLRSQATTLRVLKVFQAPITRPFKSFLCQTPMTTLKELYLWGTIVPGLDVLKCTPSLKVLYINLTCFGKRKNVKQVVNELFETGKYTKYEENLVDTVEHLMKGVVVESLETLYIDYEFPEKSLRTLAKWIPNLKVLKTIVSWNNVSAVVEEWSELKELTCLFESKIRDWNICKKKSRLRRNNGAVISDLKQLNHFQLDCSCDASNLTDTSVFHGFLKMTSLSSVQICVSKQFTDKAEEALRDRVKNCRIIRNYAGGDHSNYDCCQRREFDLEVATTGLRVKSKKYEEESESDEDVDKT